MPVSMALYFPKPFRGPGFSATGPSEWLQHLVPSNKSHC